MTPSDIVRMRLVSQGLLGPKRNTAKEVVSHMGALQAQDYAMAKWAIGIRMKGASEKAIDLAIDKGQILRTHVLRPTWHFISANDIHWMLELTGPRIKTGMRSRNKELGLSEDVFKKSSKVIFKALGKGEHLTREELLTGLQAAGIATDENRASHLLIHAELDGIISSGASKKSKRTYTLLDSLVSKKKTLKKEEALAKLATIYFNSRGPATLQDFTWWSGLAITDARKALDLVSDSFEQEHIASQTFWFNGSQITKRLKESVFLLPAFDEYLISYKDRTAAIHLQHQKKAFSSNGIFWPTVLINGQVTGLWKRSLKKDRVFLEAEFFHPHDPKLKTQLKKSADAFGQFLGVKAEINY